MGFNLLPRGARERLGRALKLDRILLDVDRSTRTAYEARAAASAPATDVIVAETAADPDPQRVRGA